MYLVPHFGHAQVYETSIWTICFQILAKTMDDDDDNIDDDDNGDDDDNIDDDDDDTWSDNHDSVADDGNYNRFSHNGVTNMQTS